MRAVGLVLAAAHIALVGWWVLRPHYAPWVAAPNLRPFATIQADLALPGLTGLRRLALGLGLLAPLGVLLPMVGARLYASAFVSFLRTVFAALMVSLVIEFAQTVVPGQIFDVDALLLNTTGAALAYLAVVPAARRGLRRRRAEREAYAEHVPAAERTAGAQSPTRRISRVGIAP
jgi:glycopeptide antibiotics resistance protein